jgi:hypothetical protein
MQPLFTAGQSGAKKKSPSSRNNCPSPPSPINSRCPANFIATPIVMIDLPDRLTAFRHPPMDIPMRE